MDLGERILIYRARHNLSQTSMAMILDENTAMISRIESGKFRIHKINEVRISMKMKELEEMDNV